MFQLKLVVRYEQHGVFIEFYKFVTKKCYKDVFDKSYHNQGGLFSVMIAVLLHMKFQILIGSKCYKWILFQDNNVLKLHNQIIVKVYGSHAKVLELVKQGGHILFTSLIIFGRYLGRYMVTEVKT